AHAQLLDLLLLIGTQDQRFGQFHCSSSHLGCRRTAGALAFAANEPRGASARSNATFGFKVSRLTKVGYAIHYWSVPNADQTPSGRRIAIRSE
ncbi:MAG: hypothetical protein ACRC1H_18795, partial [Caldilineaceae bacterium]